MVKCKICNRQLKDIDFLVSHIESEHAGQIPPDYSASQYEYFLRTGRTHGNCVVCKGKTEWNGNTNKYHRFCADLKCKDEYRETFKKRMIGKYGKVSLLDDPDQQRKMLANRKISGTYKWSDDSVEIPYVGTYELDFLQVLDLFMNLPGCDIMGPSPHTYYYMYNKEKKFYIPDFYIPSINLEIEIKDGGDNENKHPKIQAIDKVKEKLKDEMMDTMYKSINYIKIVNKNYGEFFKLFLKLREQLGVQDRVKGSASPIMEGTKIDKSDSLRLPRACNFANPDITYGTTSKEILAEVKRAKLSELKPIEDDIDTIIVYLNKVINSSSTDMKNYRMVDEAKKEKEYIETRVKPCIAKKKNQLKVIEASMIYEPEIFIMESQLDPTHNIYKPVYILLTFTGTKMSNIIKKATHQPYSHSSISFDSSLTHLYSFGRKEAGDKMCFIEESIKSGLLGQVASDTKYSLYAFMATEKQYNGIMSVLEKMKTQADKYKYNSLGLLTNFLGIETEREYKYFCSEFIADILRQADEKLLSKHPSLFTPSDLRELPQTFFVKKGTLGKYNPKDVDIELREKMLEKGLMDVE